MNYEITVIMPIFNASLYLEESLKSLINQTIFEHLEVILINDGSTDDSEKICKSYCEKYSNIILINQENSGVSTARNEGLSRGTGKYVTFMDADDVIKCDLYENELKAIKSNNYDLLIIDFEKKHIDGTIKKYRKNYIKEWECSQDAIKDFLNGTIGGQVVDKLFLYDNVRNLKFSSDYKIGEDMLFTYFAVKKSKRILMDTNLCGYQYVVRKSSAMTGEFSEKYLDPIKVSEEICEDCKENEEIRKYAEAHLIHETCKVVEYIYRHNVQDNCKKLLKDLIKKIHLFKICDAFKYLVRKQFCGYLLIKISPKLYLLFHKMMHIG